MFVVTLLLTLLGCGGETDSQTHPDPTPLLTMEERVEAFREVVGEDFIVSDGEYNFLTLEPCCVPGASCLWNNPSTPYGIYALPPGPNQTGTDAMMQPNGLARQFHLRDDEVLVLIGNTPPKAKYYSFRSYLGTVFGAQDELVIGSLGASLNHLVVADNLNDSPFSQPMALITSADAGQEQAVATLLEESGFLQKEIQLDRMVHDKGRWGLNEGADLFMAVSRIAVIEDPVEKQQFYEDPGYTLLRLTPRDPGPLTAPHTTPALPSRGTGTTEDGYRAALNDLDAAIDAMYADYDVTTAPGEHTWFETLDCIDDRFCSGDIRDRFYARSPNFKLPDDETFAVAFGVNHERTGKASYSNFSVDEIINQIGLDSRNSEQMIGSARYYLGDDYQGVDDLYAWVIARNCSIRPEPNCIEIATGCPGVDLDAFLFVSFRSYLEPTTGAAPLEEEQLADRAKVFKVPTTSTP